VVLRKQQHPRRQPDPAGDGGNVAQAQQRIEPVRIGWDGDPAVGGIRVAGPRLVDENDMLPRPQGGESPGLGGRRHRPDDLRPRSGADTQRMQSHSHRWPSPL
jgi:hypothetical protein